MPPNVAKIGRPSTPPAITTMHPLHKRGGQTMTGSAARAVNGAQGDEQKTEWHHQSQDPTGHSQGQRLSNGYLGSHKLTTGPTEAGGDGRRQAAAEDAHRDGPLRRHEGVGRHPQQPVPGGGQGGSQEPDPQGQLLGENYGTRECAATGQTGDHGGDGKQGCQGDGQNRDGFFPASQGAPDACHLALPLLFPLAAPGLLESLLTVLLASVFSGVLAGCPARYWSRNVRTSSKRSDGTILPFILGYMASVCLRQSAMAAGSRCVTVSLLAFLPGWPAVMVAMALVS